MKPWIYAIGLTVLALIAIKSDLRTRQVMDLDEAKQADATVLTTKVIEPAKPVPPTVPDITPIKEEAAHDYTFDGLIDPPKVEKPVEVARNPVNPRPTAHDILIDGISQPFTNSKTAAQACGPEGCGTSRSVFRRHTRTTEDGTTTVEALTSRCGPLGYRGGRRGPLRRLLRRG